LPCSTLSPIDAGLYRLELSSLQQASALRGDAVVAGAEVKDCIVQIQRRECHGSLGPHNRIHGTPFGMRHLLRAWEAAGQLTVRALEEAMLDYLDQRNESYELRLRI